MMSISIKNRVHSFLFSIGKHLIIRIIIAFIVSFFLLSISIQLVFSWECVNTGSCNTEIFPGVKCKAPKDDKCDNGLACPQGTNLELCKETSGGDGGSDDCPNHVKVDGCFVSNYAYNQAPCGDRCASDADRQADCGVNSHNPPHYCSTPGYPTNCNLVFYLKGYKVCPSTCKDTWPNQALLTTPDNSIFYSNQVKLDWSINGSFGQGCPENKDIMELYISKNCTGTYIKNKNLSLTATTHTLSDLNYGSQYCWKIRKSNGSKTADSIARNFTIDSPPSLSGAGVLNDICGGEFSGSLSSSSVSNPIDYAINYSDPEGDTISRVQLAFGRLKLAYAYTLVICLKFVKSFLLLVYY